MRAEQQCSVCYSTCLAAAWCVRMGTLLCENSFKMEGLSSALFAWSPPGEQWAAQGCFTLNDVQGSLSSYLQASTSMKITQPVQL